MLWFFLTLSVESSIIPIADVIAEHRLYLPSIGAATAFAASFFLVFKRFPWVWAGTCSVVAAAVIIIFFSVATYQRNQIWGDEVRLWEDVVSKSPQKPRPYNNLGNALNKVGKPWDAIPYLREALALAPYYPEANYNLGRAYLLVDQSAIAIPLFQKAIRYNPILDGAYSDLAAALNREGRYQEAATLLEQNYGRVNRMPEAHFNLGISYLYLGNGMAARRELAILSGLDPALASRLSGILLKGIQE